MHDDRATPPPQWADQGEKFVRLSDDLYYVWLDDPWPWFWHWCTRRNRWVGAATADHQQVSRNPLHLEPSLRWPCCGLHGFVREGVWCPA
jgi:hypothetical protein